MASASEQRAHFISVCVCFGFLSVSQEEWCGDRALFEENGHSPSSGRSVDVMEIAYTGQELLQIFFPRELWKLGLWFLAHPFREI